MNNNETYYDQIDPYLAGQLPPDMVAGLERAIQSDPGLAREVALRRLEFDVSETLIARSIREQMKQMRQPAAVAEGVSATAATEMPDATQRRGGFRWLVLTFALILAGLLLWWNRPADAPQTSDPALQPQPGLQNTPAATSDTPDQATPAPPAGNRLQADRKSGDRRLFAQHFTPYKDDSLEPSRRGASDLLPAEKFMQLYWEDRHREALAVFETMNEIDKGNDNLLFVRANCLLASGRAPEAATLLEQLIRNDRTRFMAEARWYLALAHLQSGRHEQARTLFLEIQADKESARRKDAERVLGQLE